jgi:hypothetical protein
LKTGSEKTKEEEMDTVATVEYYIIDASGDRHSGCEVFFDEAEGKRWERELQERGAVVGLKVSTAFKTHQPEESHPDTIDEIYNRVLAARHTTLISRFGNTAFRELT